MKQNDEKKSKINPKSIKHGPKIDQHIARNRGLEASWRRLGGVLGRLGGVLEAFWGVLGGLEPS